MNHNQKIGKWGEQAAAEYLLGRGYEIVERNARTPYGEIDLVARQEGFTVFVEVKARTTRSFGLPEEALTPRKLRHMRAAAGHYAAEHEIDNWQCDAIAVEGSPSLEPRFEHFENVTADLE
ncbi:MAG: YraN family protein [Anaerolineales bacterium]|jgi:putative endonuclease|nr:YraN family protein [Anaerolineales bacterium]